ncbi:hypothetical protein EVAR_565_1 [Eumeta japonica]|uniref:Uncharacterized protein n=1 Tax=Eumeta variegata TaxID=151549 RepID=A0A4C1SD48_EUMVA|nr:hypothetical protein EVAR_565_1 [Eumeta japonica]
MQYDAQNSAALNYAVPILRHCDALVTNFTMVVSPEPKSKWDYTGSTSFQIRKNYQNQFSQSIVLSGGAKRRRRRRPPTASRLKGPRKQKSFAYKLLKRGLAKRFAYKLLKRGLANLMSPTSTSGVASPLDTFASNTGMQGVPLHASITIAYTQDSS